MVERAALNRETEGSIPSLPAKLCSKCKKNPKRKNGSYCSYCHNEYQKQYYKNHPLSTNASAKRRKKEVRDIVKEAKNVPCMDCGESYPYYVMDFDHVRGKKRFNLSVAASKYRSMKSLQEEIEKCDIVCSNCHRIRTFERIISGHSVLVSENSL